MKVRRGSVVKIRKFGPIFGTALCSLALLGCSTLGKSVGAGAAAGGALGAAASWSYSKGDSAKRAKNVVIGTALGAGVGAVAGHAIHKSQEKKIQAAIEESRRKTGRAPQGYFGDPSGLANGRWEPAKLERRYLEGYVDGNIYHEPHFVWVLIEPGKFRN